MDASNAASSSSTGGAAVPQDIELIMQMVQGEMPRLPATAVATEEMRPGEGVGETATDSEASDGSSEEEDDSEDGSSEDDESSEDEVDVGPSKAGSSTAAPPLPSNEPLTADRHASLLSQLTSFLAGDEANLDVNGEGHITEDSDDEDEDEDDSMEVPVLDQSRFEEIEDDDEDMGDSGPLITANEIVEEPVKAPPIRRLPQGAPVTLAGEVMSYIPDPIALRIHQEAQKERTQQQAETKQVTVVPTEGGAARKDEDTAQPAEETSAAQDEHPSSDAKVGVLEEATAAQGEQQSNDVQMEVSEEGEIAEPIAESSSSALPLPTATSNVDDLEEEDLVDLEAGLADSNSDDDQDKAPAPSTSLPVTSADLSASTPAAPASAPSTNKGKAKEKGKHKEPKMMSGGKVVVRALRPPEGFHIGERRVGDDEGWLEEGSLICFKDGTVLATIAETFGPLTSPFYLLRLPPPPFPIPDVSSLTPGTQLFYPSSANRSYVPVRLLRTDKRFKGSDASNRYDEEVGDEEKEWSDDEEEIAAKRKERTARKHDRDDGAVLPGAPRPSRQPHFDYAGAQGDSVDGALDYEGTGEANSAVRGAGLPQRPATGAVNDRDARGGRGGRGGDRGRGRGGRGGRGGFEGGGRGGRGNGRNADGGRAVGRGFGRTEGRAGRGRGNGPRASGVPYPPPISKPSDATINMAAQQAARAGSPTSSTIAKVTGMREDVPSRPPAPPASLPPRPVGQAPPSPGQSAYSPRQPFQGGGPAMPAMASFPQWNQPQHGAYMGGMMPQAGYYAGMPQQQMAVMNPYYQGGSQPGLPFMGAPYGYPSFPHPNAGGAINPRFMQNQQFQGGAPGGPAPPQGGARPNGGPQ